MKIGRELDSGQKVSIVIDALKAGNLRVRVEDEARVKELLALPRGVMGLVDISRLSPETLAFARVAATALTGMRQEMEVARGASVLSLPDAQCRLFRHYDRLFSALIGTSSETVASIDELKERMIERVRHRHGLEVLIQEQKKSMKDIEARYSAKNWTSGAKGVIGALAGASMFFLPSLAATIGVTAPIAMALGAVGAGGTSMAANTIGGAIEKRRARRSMLGMLATAKSVSR